MKKRNIVLGFVASLILLTSYMFGSYRVFTKEYLKNIEYMDMGYKLNYIAIIPIILLIIHFLIVIIKKKNTILTKVLLIAVVIMNILIGVLGRITNLSNIISVIFNVLLLAYLIKIWFMSQISLNNKVIIVAFGVMIATYVVGNIYVIISTIQQIKYAFNSFMIALLSSVLSQVAYILLAFYYNNLYFENDNENRTKERL